MAALPSWLTLAQTDELFRDFVMAVYPPSQDHLLCLGTIPLSWCVVELPWCTRKAILVPYRLCNPCQVGRCYAAKPWIASSLRILYFFFFWVLWAPHTWPLNVLMYYLRGAKSHHILNACDLSWIFQNWVLWPYANLTWRKFCAACWNFMLKISAMVPPLY